MTKGFITALCLEAWRQHVTLDVLRQFLVIFRSRSFSYIIQDVLSQKPRHLAVCLDGLMLIKSYSVKGTLIFNFVCLNEDKSRTEPQICGLL